MFIWLKYIIYTIILMYNIKKKNKKNKKIIKKK